MSDKHNIPPRVCTFRLNKDYLVRPDATIKSIFQDQQETIAGIVDNALAILAVAMFQA